MLRHKIDDKLPPTPFHLWDLEVDLQFLARFNWKIVRGQLLSEDTSPLAVYLDLNAESYAADPYTARQPTRRARVLDTGSSL